MYSKLARTVADLEVLLSIMFFNLLVTWSCKIKSQTKTIISPLTRCLFPSNVVEMWLFVRGSRPWSHTWRKLFDHLDFRDPWQNKTIISPLPLPLYLQEDPIIMWFCEIKWQAKIIIYALHYDNAYGYQIFHGGYAMNSFPPQRYKAPWSGDLARLHEKLDLLYPMIS